MPADVTCVSFVSLIFHSIERLEPLLSHIGCTLGNITVVQRQVRALVVHVTCGKAAANPRKIKNRRLFSPEIFSAGFGVFPLPRVDQAAHLLSANLFACAGGCCESW